MPFGACVLCVYGDVYVYILFIWNKAKMKTTDRECVLGIIFFFFCLGCSLVMLHLRPNGCFAKRKNKEEKQKMPFPYIVLSNAFSNLHLALYLITELTCQFKMTDLHEIHVCMGINLIYMLHIIRSTYNGVIYSSSFFSSIFFRFLHLPRLGYTCSPLL